MKKVSILIFMTLMISNNSIFAKLNDDKAYQPKPYVEITHPEWSKNATIYQVNVRQFTPEGTFKAFESHLPRLKAMGVDILWLMPIHPVGVKNRKGSLGSYYSVKDYLAVNPEFGTMDEFKSLVKKVHGMGMHLILDWVANHSAWDNALTKTHPEWYSKNIDGNFQPTPWYDWDDIIDFDYDQPGLRKYMTNAMKFWVKECDIDGYRCDVASFIPVDFWDNTRKELDAIKPVFMLAEAESFDLHKKAFDMCYSWSLWDRLKSICTGSKTPGYMFEFLAHDVNIYPKNGYRMNFTENHDKNSWEGTQYSNFGKGLETSMVFCTVANGMPMVYGGQEAGLNKSLKFFDKDIIEWKEHPFAQIYTKLFQLKHSNQAIWNGAYGGEMIRVVNDKMDKIISFYRQKNDNRVLSLFNFGTDEISVKIDARFAVGEYVNYFTGEKIQVNGKDSFTLPAWGYLILVK